jgi:4-amino-4-deoxy-L-arabinose transferase-like glycosyltransferase
VSGRYELRSTKYEVGQVEKQRENASGRTRKKVRRISAARRSGTRIPFASASPLVLRTSHFVLLLLLAALALLLVYARPLTQTIVVGATDDRAATRDFFERERSPDGKPYRWTGATSTLIFRGVGLAFPANRPVSVAITVAASRPAGATAPRVTLAVDGAQIDARPVPAEAQITADLGVARGTATDTPVTIGSNTFTPPGDRRALGVAILGPARLVEGSGHGMAIPPLGAWWRWLLVLGCGWGVALGFLRRPGPAMAAAGALLVMGTLAAALARPHFWGLIHLPLLLLLALLPLAWRDALARLAVGTLGAIERRFGIPTPLVTLLGLVPLAAAQALLSGDRRVPLALALGALGLVIVLATLVGHAADTPLSAVSGGEGREEATADARRWRPRSEIPAPLAILVLAAAARFYDLSGIPFGMWRDEARHGLEGLHILADPAYRPVYIPNISLPGLYPTLLALDFRLFGASLATLRGLTAGAGTLAVAALWLVGRQLGGPRVALVAALLGAVGSWRVSIDRLAFDTAPTSLCTLGAFALFLVGVARVRGGGHGLSPLAGAGILGGLAIYNYYPGRFALPVLAGGALVLLLRERDGFARRFLPGLVLCLLMAALTLIPLGRYAIEQPDTFFKRTEQVFLLSDQYLEGQTVLGAVEQNLLRHVAMFNYRGEPNARHHAPGWPLLDAVTGVLFVLGLALTIGAALRCRFAALFLLGWWGALLAPSIVSVDAPSAVRAQDAAPAAYLLAAFGLVALWERLRARDAPHPLRRAAPALVGAALTAAIGINLWLYFGYMADNPAVIRKFQYAGETRAGLAIRAARERDPAVVAYLPNFFLANGDSYNVLRFTSGEATLRELPNDPGALPAGPLLIVVPRGEEQDFERQVADARRIAAAAGLREVPGERAPGGGALTYVTFVR